MATDTATFLEGLKSTFPWLGQLGIDPALVRDWAVQYPSTDAILEQLRKTPQYQARFPALRRPDGTLRMNEAQYISTEENYRTILKQFNDTPNHYDNPADFQAFFDNEIDPNELKQRYTLYDQLKSTGRDTTDAFYVYAGMKVSTDDLYQATVSPEYAQKMTDEYNQKIAAQPLDYATWITRATEAGLSRVADTLGQLQKNGAVTGTAVSQTLATDPQFARTMMDALYHGGDPTNRTLSLTELMHSFELAMIGSAATGQGLELPSLDRISAIRDAGINRAKAIDVYGQYASQKNLLSGEVARLNSGQQFTQGDFEKAVFLRQAPEADLMAKATGLEQAAGARSGSAAISVGRNGELQQKQLAAPFAR